MKKILIIKTSAYGDIIHTYPTVNYLRNKFPDAQIDWVVETPCADLVKAHPAVSNVLTVDTKEWRRSPFSFSTFTSVKRFRERIRRDNYDVIFDLQGNTKSGVILSQARGNAKVGFGRRSASEWPNWFFTNKKYDAPFGRNIREDYLSLATLYFDDPKPVLSQHVDLQLNDAQRLQLLAALSNPVLKGKTKVIVCPGSAWKNKQMNEQSLVSFLRKVGKRLDSVFLFAWGNADEKRVAEELHIHFHERSIVLDKMSLPLLQNMMSHCDLVIAMDSLPLHLAGTTTTATASVFGPSVATKYCPAGPRHFSFQGTCPYGRTFEKRCPVLRTCATGACIRDLTGDEVFASFDNWWMQQQEEVPLREPSAALKLISQP